MQDTDRRSSAADLDHAFGGFFKGIGAVLDVLADALGPAAEPVPQRPPRDSSDQPVVRARSLITDVFDEGRDILIVIELPGVQPDRIRIDVQDDIFALEITGDPPYIEEVLLPDLVSAPTLRWAYRNGILEAHLEKRGTRDSS